MNARRVIKWVVIMAVVAVLAFVALSFPRTRSLLEGYTYAYFPRGGHRYLIAPGGIKKVGQEVLDYHVTGTVVTGTVRLRLEHGGKSGMLRALHRVCRWRSLTSVVGANS